LYAEKDVYILDDILSAVDSHVAQELATNVVVGHLKAKEKTVLFVSNQLQFLPLSDKVIMMNKGEIVEQGTYNKLKVRKFSNFLKLVDMTNNFLYLVYLGGWKAILQAYFWIWPHRWYQEEKEEW